MKRRRRPQLPGQRSLAQPFAERRRHAPASSKTSDSPAATSRSDSPIGAVAAINVGWSRSLPGVWLPVSLVALRRSCEGSPAGGPDPRSTCPAILLPDRRPTPRPHRDRGDELGQIAYHFGPADWGWDRFDQCETRGNVATKTRRTPSGPRQYRKGADGRARRSGAAGM